MNQPGAAVDFATWQAVSDCLQAYADALDRADLAGILAAFAEDAVWDYRPGAPLVGHGAIRDFFSHVDVFAQTSHHVGPPAIRPGPSPGSFDSVAYFIATHILRAGGAYTVYGRYADRFDGTPLRIRHRRVIAHVTQGTDRPYTFLKRVAR